VSSYVYIIVVCMCMCMCAVRCISFSSNDDGDDDGDGGDDDASVTPPHTPQSIEGNEFFSKRSDLQPAPLVARPHPVWCAFSLPVAAACI
jgi:hypothetical protein